MSDAPSTCLLLVEDDALVRLTVAMMLEDHGFRVVEAATGEEALRLMQEGLDAPVMVTDVDLGAGVNGLELADNLRARRPDLVIVFITGRVASLRGRPLGPREAVLPKPFEAGELAELVRRLAAAPPAPGTRDRAAEG